MVELTIKEYMMGRDIMYPPTPIMKANAKIIIERINKLLNLFGEKRAIVSGYRPKLINTVNGGALKSKHLTCEACDLEDLNKKLKEWCKSNTKVLEELGLWMEHPDYTPTWCHLQIVPPLSGKRIFIP